MKAAVGLEIAGREGDDLILAAHPDPVARELEPGVGIGAHLRRVHAFVQQADAGLHGRGEQASLPGGGGVAPVAGGEAQAVDGIAHLQARPVILARRRELRIEADIRAARVIEELEIREQRNLREHVLHEQRLAPAGMSHQQVRDDAVRLQPPAHRRHRRAAAHRLVEGAHIWMHLRRAGGLRLVDELDHARQLQLRRLGDEIHPVVRHFGQAARDVHVLRREILVDEDDDHALGITARARPSTPRAGRCRPTPRAARVRRALSCCAGAARSRRSRRRSAARGTAWG